LSSFALLVFSVMGIAINPHYYPWNIPQVREAICDVINRTEVAAAWGLAISKPAYYPNPVIPGTEDTYPPDVRQFITSCSYDPAKAAQMLESLGFKKINGILVHTKRDSINALRLWSKRLYRLDDNGQ